MQEKHPPKGKKCKLPKNIDQIVDLEHFKVGVLHPVQQPGSAALPLVGLKPIEVISND